MPGCFLWRDTQRPPDVPRGRLSLGARTAHGRQAAPTQRCGRRPGQTLPLDQDALVQRGAARLSRLEPPPGDAAAPSHHGRCPGLATAPTVAFTAISRSGPARHWKTRVVLGALGLISAAGLRSRGWLRRESRTSL